MSRRCCNFSYCVFNLFNESVSGSELLKLVIAAVGILIPKSNAHQNITRLFNWLMKYKILTFTNKNNNLADLLKLATVIERIGSTWFNHF